MWSAIALALVVLSLPMLATVKVAKPQSGRRMQHISDVEFSALATYTNRALYLKRVRVGFSALMTVDSRGDALAELAIMDDENERWLSLGLGPRV